MYTPPPPYKSYRIVKSHTFDMRFMKKTKQNRTKTKNGEYMFKLRDNLKNLFIDNAQHVLSDEVNPIIVCLGTFNINLYFVPNWCSSL